MANVLGINLSELSPSEVLKKIADFLHDNKQHYIVTPNAEIILASHKDEEFFYILNQADLSLADGSGPQIAAWLFGTKVPRITGADTTVELLKLAAQEKLKVMVLNLENGLSSISEINDALNTKFPGLIFSVININRDILLSPEIIKTINDFQPVILFNALGFPYQEKSIYHNLKKLPSVKVALGIGGSFDFITEKIKRAPKVFRSLGLEWLWRLLNIFKYKNTLNRLKRIYTATVIFVLEVIKTRFINPHFYRANVACFLYKKEGSDFQVLLVERTDQSGHWQLPQGGTDGESLTVAGARELREELGTDKFSTVATFKKVHRYEFRDRKNNFITNDSKLYKFDHKGQSQGLYIGKFTGTDQDIKINFWDHQNFKWVNVNDLVSSVHPVRREASEKFLKKFQSLNLN